MDVMIRIRHVFATSATTNAQNAQTVIHIHRNPMTIISSTGQGIPGVTLSCQVCHAQPYRNCNGCHVGGDMLTGSSYCAFEIGRNYLKSNERYKEI